MRGHTMPPPDVPFVAAKYSLGLVTSDELVAVADAILTSGIYSYALGRLYDMASPNYHDASRLFATALKELDIPLPDEAQAWRTVVTHYLWLIAEGTCTPLDGLRRFRKEVHATMTYGIITNSITETPEWKALSKSWWDYEWTTDYIGAEAISEEGGERQLDALGDRLAKFAEAWARKHRPVSVPGSLLTRNGGAVRDLAQAIADEHRFDDLPILADALEDAGCTSAEILQHCRWPGEHLRGCWVVDLLLGKR
jgi:hypothetical protein